MLSKTAIILWDVASKCVGCPTPFYGLRKTVPRTRLHFTAKSGDAHRIWDSCWLCTCGAYFEMRFPFVRSPSAHWAPKTDACHIQDRRQQFPETACHRYNLPLRRGAPLGPYVPHAVRTGVTRIDTYPRQQVPKAHALSTVCPEYKVSKE